MMRLWKSGLKITLVSLWAAVCAGFLLYTFDLIGWLDISFPVIKDSPEFREQVLIRSILAFGLPSLLALWLASKLMRREKPLVRAIPIIVYTVFAAVYCYQLWHLGKQIDGEIYMAIKSFVEMNLYVAGAGLVQALVVLLLPLAARLWRSTLIEAAKHLEIE